MLHVKDGANVSKKDLLVEYDPTTMFKFSQSEGIVKIINSEDESRAHELFVYDPKDTETVVVSKDVADSCVVGHRFETTDVKLKNHFVGLVNKISPSAKSKATEKFDVEIVKGRSYLFFKGATLYVKDNDKVKPGDVLIEEKSFGTEASKTSDIVQGLPRVEELFEARKPKDCAMISELDGVVDLVKSGSVRKLIVYGEAGQKKDYKISKDTILLVSVGQSVKKGDKLTEGGINPHDILATKSVEETQEFLSKEVMKVYRSQGVQVNLKHVETIVRQMTRRIVITEVGESNLLPNEMIDINVFNQVNEDLESDGKVLASGNRVLLGVTRASLSTDSFVSASSFQQTASVLTKAAIENQTDPMVGLKENVIIGNLIPAGTGQADHQHLTLVYDEND